MKDHAADNLAQSLLSYIIVFACLATTTVNAQQLYKEYKYGTSKDALLLDRSIYQCGRDYHCKDKHSFMGVDLQLALGLMDDRLAEVNLVFSDPADPFQKALPSIARTGDRTLVAIRSPKNASSLDVVEVAKNNLIEEAGSIISRFETGAMSAGSIGYSLLESTSIRTILQDVNSAAELFSAMPEAIREADVHGSDDEGIYYIKFTVPKKHLNSVGTLPEEKF